jgi:hypothetical protein
MTYIGNKQRQHVNECVLSHYISMTIFSNNSKIVDQDDIT